MDGIYKTKEIAETARDKRALVLLRKHCSVQYYDEGHEHGLVYDGVEDGVGCTGTESFEVEIDENMRARW